MTLLLLSSFDLIESFMTIAWICQLIKLDTCLILALFFLNFGVVFLKSDSREVFLKKVERFENQFKVNFSF
jgi:uncharacterized protein (DUF486 family)